jgi:O-antigen/teichoic acid export membrane protein
MILKSTLIVFFANALAHLINYAYHFIAGHFLTPDQFGLLESFVSLNYFLAVIISSFSLAIIHQLNQTPKTQRPNLIHSLQSFSLKLTFIIWLLALLSFPLLKRLLHFNNPYLLLIFSIQILFSFLPTLYLSLIQAKLKFKQLSIINLLAPLTKTVIALILFLLSFQVFGALIAMSLAGLVPAVLSFWFVKIYYTLKSKSKASPLPISFYKFGLLAFITSLSLTSLYNSDVLLVRFFISHQSGLYAAASILTKIIFFVSSAVLTVTFPIFTSQTKDIKKLKTSFQNSLLLITSIALLGTSFYQLYPQLIIKLFSNPAYSNAVNFLPGLSLFIFFFTILNLLSQLLLTISQTKATMVTAFTAVTQLTLIFFFHQSISQVILSSLTATLAGLTLASAVIIKTLYVKA